MKIYDLLNLIILFCIIYINLSYKESFTPNFHSLRSFKNKKKRDLLRKYDFYKDEVLYKIKKLSNFLRL